MLSKKQIKEAILNCDYSKTKLWGLDMYCFTGYQIVLIIDRIQKLEIENYKINQ